MMGNIVLAVTIESLVVASSDRQNISRRRRSSGSEAFMQNVFNVAKHLAVKLTLHQKPPIVQILLAIVYNKA